jgi:hypothetical protein
VVSTRAEKHLIYPCFKTFESSTKVGKLGRSDEDRGEFLDNDASKVEVLGILRKLGPSNKSQAHLFLFKNLGKRLVDTFCAEVEAQLSNYQTSTRLEQPSVCAKKIQQVDHKGFEIAVIRRGRDLGKKLQVVFDDLF